MRYDIPATGSAARSSLVAAVAMVIVSGCAGATPSPTPTAALTATTLPTSTPRTTFIASAGHDRALGLTVSLPASGWRWDDIAIGFSKGDEVNDLPEALVLLWSWPAGTGFYVFGDPCRWVSTKPATPVTTPDKIVAGLAAQASRAASAPADVTIGGYAAKSTTLHVPDDAVFAKCDDGTFASYGVTDDELVRYHQGPGQIDRFWVVDVNGAIAIIDATYRPDTPAELINEMQAIAESITFDGS